MVEFRQVIEQRPSLFREDLLCADEDLKKLVTSSRFLIIGGAGSIGQAVVKQVLLRNPSRLHVVDISENNLAELVRDIRSSDLNVSPDFRTFAIDIDSAEFDQFIKSDGGYDYIFNLAALKHVRSEKDPFTLMRMLRVNTLHTQKLLEVSELLKVRKYFSVSSDKASRPVNLMGASKRIMEMMLYRYRERVPVSTARFANVAFSDGSLLHSFTMRLAKKQPITVPSDVKRYFISHKESGELCLMSCLLGESSDIYFPKFFQSQHLTSLSDIAISFIESHGYKAVFCDSEEEAKSSVKAFVDNGEWPFYLSESDTTGEKRFEEFYHHPEKVMLDQFRSIGIVKNMPGYSETVVNRYENSLNSMINDGSWNKQDLIDLIAESVPELAYVDLGRSLDEKM